MCSDKDKGCGCNSSHDEQGCGCGTQEKKQDNCGCGDDSGCGCGGGHEHQSVTLTLHDDTQIECPIIDAFEVNGQGYIALLHPLEQTALLYRYDDNDDESINITNIETDEEFELVSKTFLALHDHEDHE